jgi:hypothetical protein
MTFGTNFNFIIYILPQFNRLLISISLKNRIERKFYCFRNQKVNNKFSFKIFQMIYKDKEILFSNFLLKWNDQFSKIPHILQYLSSYQAITNKLDDIIFLSIKELHDSQLEWVALVSQFDNSIEKEFFKECWVPIGKNRYHYYIDLSSDLLPLFEDQYIQFEPYRWFKNYIFKDLSQFLIDIDKSDFDIENHFNKVGDSYFSEFYESVRERDKLGFEGRLKLDQIDKDSVFCEDEESTFSIQDNCITFNCVNALIVGLLPYDCNITLKEFKPAYEKEVNVFDKVKSIKVLVYLLQSVGFLSVDSYSITFDSDKISEASFQDNTFKIIHNDLDLLREMIKKYDTLKNS